MRTTAVSLALVLLAAATALAQVPRTINYQGRVAGATGTLEGEHQMVLKIYDAGTGGTLLFAETQNVTFSKGIFTVAIGGGTPGGISSSVDFSRQLWLGVTISGFNGGNEIAPRYILRSSPYSFRAITADSAVVADRADSAVTAWRADSATTAKNLLAPATIQNNGKNEALTVLNDGGIGLHVRGTPYAVVSDGIDSVGRYMVIGESAGSKNAPAAGAYYHDNAPLAWGTINRNGSIASDFGITSVTMQADSSFIITFDNPLQTTLITDQSVPQFAPVITVGGLSGQVDATPVYAYWTYRRDPSGNGYDAKSIVVHIVPVLSQGLQLARPFSIVVFGRP